MSDAVAIAVITSLAPTILSIVALWVAIRGYHRNGEK